ncbi:hypothetical protein FQN50_006589 [Emmonsiellopsis sp. PD_5]|nr:hypothetical protein FQN50_006589 [Emmonsiellopsis sp. PD_5]
MPSYTLLDYLTEPNPKINNGNSKTGPPTEKEPENDVRIEDWTDFTLDTLSACYGDILRGNRPEPCPDISPSLTMVELEIWDEDSLEHLLTRTVVPAVNFSLKEVWAKHFPDNEDKVIEMTRGGRATMAQNLPRGIATRQASPETPGQVVSESMKGSSNRSDAKSNQVKSDPIFPDWAGAVRAADGVHHVNRCPGETKLSTKWHSRRDIDARFYLWPIAQVLEYCGENWGTRYGYLITQEELVVMRLSRERIESGIAGKRSPRAAASRPRPPAFRSHQPNISLTSNTSKMSIDDGVSGRSRESSLSSPTDMMTDSYQDNSQWLEYQPVEMKSIPWSNHGPGMLTVKLALWWIHMLAAAPGCDAFVGRDYPRLNSWIPTQGGYRHTSTGIFKDKLADGDIISEQSHQRPSTPRSQVGTFSSFSSLSSPPSQLGSSPSRMPP